MTNELFANLDKVHTTELGIKRIRKNLGLDTEDVVAWCHACPNSNAHSNLGRHNFMRAYLYAGL